MANYTGVILDIGAAVQEFKTAVDQLHAFEGPIDDAISEIVHYIEDGDLAEMGLDALHSELLHRGQQCDEPEETLILADANVALGQAIIDQLRACGLYENDVLPYVFMGWVIPDRDAYFGVWTEEDPVTDQTVFDDIPY